ncbi:MAG: galactose mutarotase [Bacteroidales bacterium]|nr:galactose mutarotase [Bacteroidales bacterium]
MKLKLITIAAILAAVLSGCSKAPLAGITEESFGTLKDGSEAKLYTVVNANGASLVLSDYGARIVSIFMPDRNGEMEDVIVGAGDLATFENAKPERFLGCIVGRYGNRINHASFTLDGVEYKLEANENLAGVPVQCHGASQGMDRFLWESEKIEEEGRRGVKMHRLSPDGESGFPGNCDCFVTYWLTDDNTVEVDYEATTDKPTVINLSNHSFFNMHGARYGSYVMEQLFTVEADSCIQNNLQMCPDLILPVDGTPFDFREPHRVDYRLDMPSRHLEIMHGMSACWCIRDYDGTLRKAATLYDRRSGRGVETWTTEPAILTYTARGFNGSLQGKYGPVEKFGGMLLETIHFADSPNQPRFPSTALRPGEEYYSTTEWRFYKK